MNSKYRREFIRRVCLETATTLQNKLALGYDDWQTMADDLVRASVMAQEEAAKVTLEE